MLTSLIGSLYHSVGVVRDALIAWEASQRDAAKYFGAFRRGETYDGVLSDINGQHVHPNRRERDRKCVRGRVLEGTSAPGLA